MQRPRTHSATWYSYAVIGIIISSALLLAVPMTKAQPTRVTLSPHPVGAALDYTNHEIYIANRMGFVQVFDPNSGTVTRNITTGGSLSYIAFDNTTSYLFATNSSGVVVISGASNTVLTRIPTLNFTPYGIAAGNGSVFVTGNTTSGTGMLKVIDVHTLKVTANITIPASYPGIPAFDPKDNRVYVPGFKVQGGSYGNMTYTIDLGTKTVVDTVPVPSGPFLAAYGFGKIYIAEANSSNVAVINLSVDNVVANLTAGFAPDGIAFAYSPAIGVSSYGVNGSGSFAFIDPSTGLVSQQVADSGGPKFIVYDPYNSVFYVTDYNGYLEEYQWSESVTTATTSGTTPTTPTSSTTATSTSTPPASSSTTGSTRTTTSASSGSSSSAASTTSVITTPPGSGNSLYDSLSYVLPILALGVIMFGYYWFRMRKPA